MIKILWHNIYHCSVRLFTEIESWWKCSFGAVTFYRSLFFLQGEWEGLPGVETRAPCKHSSTALQPRGVASYYGAGVSGLTLATCNKNNVTKRQVAIFYTCSIYPVFPLFYLIFNMNGTWVTFCWDNKFKRQKDFLFPHNHANCKKNSKCNYTYF